MRAGRTAGGWVIVPPHPAAPGAPLYSPHAARIDHDVARRHAGRTFPRAPLATARAARARRDAGLHRTARATRPRAPRLARRRRIASRRAQRHDVRARARAVPGGRLPHAARARLDAAGAGRQPRRPRIGHAAAALRVRAVRAPRRRDGELCRAGRRRRSARGFVRRVPAAGLRPAPLALGRAEGPGTAVRHAGEDPAALPPHRRCGARTGRHAVRPARPRARRGRARRVHDVVDRLSRTGLAGPRRGLPRPPARHARGTRPPRRSRASAGPHATSSASSVRT